MVGGNIVEVFQGIVLHEVLIEEGIHEFIVLLLSEVGDPSLVIYFDFIVLVLEQFEEVLTEQLENSI